MPKLKSTTSFFGYSSAAWRIELAQATVLLAVAAYKTYRYSPVLGECNGDFASTEQLVDPGKLPKTPYFIHSVSDSLGIPAWLCDVDDYGHPAGLRRQVASGQITPIHVAKWECCW